MPQYSVLVFEMGSCAMSCSCFWHSLAVLCNTPWQTLTDVSLAHLGSIKHQEYKVFGEIEGPWEEISADLHAPLQLRLPLRRPRRNLAGLFLWWLQLKRIWCIGATRPLSLGNNSLCQAEA